MFNVYSCNYSEKIRIFAIHGDSPDFFRQFNSTTSISATDGQTGQTLLSLAWPGPAGTYFTDIPDRDYHYLERFLLLSGRL